MTTAHNHDSYLASLAALPPQKLWTINPDGEIRPLVEVTLPALLPKLSPSQTDLRGDIDRVVPEIVHWGRLVAIQKRVWTARERELRTWKAKFELDFRQAQAGTKDGWGQGGKVSSDQVEANYRVAAEYKELSGLLEGAEESYLFADAVYRAYRSKLDVLLADVRRVGDGSLQRISP